MSIQILVPLARQGNPEELRYAVRSWEKAYGAIELVFVGPQKPALFPGAKWIQAADRSQLGYRNIVGALKKASESELLRDEFLYMNDDIYVIGVALGDAQMTFYEGTLAEKVESFSSGRYNPYRESIKQTMEELTRRGNRTRLNFEVHTPMMMTKKALQEAIAICDESPHLLQVRSLVGNLSKPKTVYVGMTDVKIRESGPKITEWPHTYLSSQDTVFNRVHDFLKEKFPEPSKAELSRWEGEYFGSLGGSKLELKLPAELYERDGLRPFNPSIAWLKGKLWMSLRYSFFWKPGVDDSGLLLDGKTTNGKYGVSYIVLAELNADTYEVKQWKQLELVGAPESHANLGLEDVRLFEDGGKLFGIGVFLHKDGTPNGNHQQAIVRIAYQTGKAHFVQLLERTPEEFVEKNWSPVEGKPDTFLYSATQKWELGKVSGPRYSGEIHGGSQLLRRPDTDGYFAVVHNFVSRKNSVSGRKERHYVHYWAFFDAELKMTGLSEPWIFEWKKPIEFVSGLAWAQGPQLEAIVSYGVGDSDAELAVMPWEAIAAQEKPYSEERVVRG